MGKKFYAVRKGRTPGVYTTWADCERQVKGYSGAIFKSFPTAEEALAFTKNVVMSRTNSFDNTHRSIRTQNNTIHRNNKLSHQLGNSKQAIKLPEPVKPDFSVPNHVIAYIDGSYHKGTGTVGAGGVIFLNGKQETFSFPNRDETYRAFWNVSGELLAAMYVMQYAVDKGIDQCSLYYDYMGIEMWATKGWKRNTVVTKGYADFYDSIKDRVTVHFHKVAAHTGDTYNEMADMLAKKGAGIK